MSREHFERYAYQMGQRDFELNEEGGYKNPHTQWTYDFWVASRDALRVELKSLSERWK